MKPFFVLIVLLSIFTACNRRSSTGISVKVKNNSNAEIRGLRITTSEQLAAINTRSLKENEDLEGFLNMNDNRTDGSYVISFTRKNGKTERFSRGYYTNGGSLETNMQVEIKADTTLVSFSGTNY